MNDGPDCFGLFEQCERCWRCPWCRECNLWALVSSRREKTED